MTCVEDRGEHSVAVSTGIAWSGETIYFCLCRIPFRVYELALSSTRAENLLHLCLLVAAQRRTQYGPAVSAELISYNVGIADAKDREDRRVTRLDECSNPL